MTSVARTTARALKQRADSVLEDVFRALFEEIDTEKIRKEVAALRESAPDYEAAEHARTLARRTAIRCAAAGAVTGLPLGLIALGTLGADLAYLVYQQFRMILGIATVLGTAAIDGGFVAEKIGTRLVRERLARFVPFIGAVSGGALNYAAVHAVGRSAIRYYESRVENRLADEIWAEGDREHA